MRTWFCQLLRLAVTYAACMHLLVATGESGQPYYSIVSFHSLDRPSNRSGGNLSSSLVFHRRTVVVPSMGESMTEGTIAAVLKGPGAIGR